MNNRLCSKFSQLGAHLARLPLSMARQWQNWQHALTQRQDTGNKGSTNTGNNGSTNTGNNGKSQCPKWGRWGSKRDGDRSDALDPRKVKCDQCKVSLHQLICCHLQDKYIITFGNVTLNIPYLSTKVLSTLSHFTPVEDNDAFANHQARWH